MEIEKENQVTSAEKNITEEFQQLFNRYLGKKRNYLSLFKGIESKNKRWQQIKSQKRDHNNQIPYIGREEREILKFIYTLLVELKKKKPMLLERMKDFLEGDTFNSGGEIIEETTNSSLTAEEVFRFIGWTDSRVRMTKQSHTYKGLDTKSWGVWNQNPYSFFYDNEREWEEDIEWINNFQKVIQDDIDYYKGSIPYIRQEKYRRKILKKVEQLEAMKYSQSTQKHVEAKVAEKLLLKIEKMRKSFF